MIVFKGGVCTSLRRLFACVGLNERNGDFTSTVLIDADAATTLNESSRAVRPKVAVVASNLPIE